MSIPSTYITTNCSRQYNNSAVNYFSSMLLPVLLTQAVLQHVTICFIEATQLLNSKSVWSRQFSIRKNTASTHHRRRNWAEDSAPVRIVASYHQMLKPIDNRLAKANKASSGLYKRVWGDNDLTTSTKISVCVAILLTTLLYGSELWATYRHHLRLIESINLHCHCKMNLFVYCPFFSLVFSFSFITSNLLCHSSIFSLLGVKWLYKINYYWKDLVINIEVLESAGSLDAATLVRIRPQDERPIPVQDCAVGLNSKLYHDNEATQEEI